MEALAWLQFKVQSWGKLALRQMCPVGFRAVKSFRYSYRNFYFTKAEQEGKTHSSDFPFSSGLLLGS